MLFRSDIDWLLREEDVIDLLGGFVVIHTPGHSKGSICLYNEKNGILISGDLIRNENGVLEGPPDYFTTDSTAAALSLEKIACLDFEILLPGHGEIILKKAGDIFRSRLEEGKIWPFTDM